MIGIYVRVSSANQDTKSQERELASWAKGQDGELTQYAIIRNMSSAGLSVYLESGFAVDTLLIVEPLSSGRAPLLARVTNLTPDGKGWRHGCELATHLNKEDLSFWLDATLPLSKDEPVLA